MLSKNNLENSDDDKVVDRILCVWFCGPKKTFVFGSQKLSIREGLSDSKNTVSLPKEPPEVVSGKREARTLVDRVATWCFPGKEGVVDVRAGSGRRGRD